MGAPRLRQGFFGIYLCSSLGNSYYFKTNAALCRNTRTRINAGNTTNVSAAIDNLFANAIAAVKTVSVLA